MSFTDGDDGHATMDAASFNTHLFEQMRCMHLQWLEKLREIRDLELDYGASLAATKSPSEAVLLCSEWMAKRLEIIAHEQKDFARFWVQLLLDITAGDTPHRLGKSSATSSGKS